MKLKISLTQARWAAHVLAVPFIIAVTSLFILSFTSSALGQGSMQGDSGILQGEIVGFDNAHNIQTLTLRLGHFPNDTLNIFMNEDTKLQVCNESKPLVWSEGRNATVKYHEAGGVAVADSISEQC
jgi:hypothetical protein